MLDKIPLDSCTFPTKEIMSIQNFNFASKMSKFPKNVRFSAQDFAFPNTKFLTKILGKKDLLRKIIFWQCKIQEQGAQRHKVLSVSAGPIQTMQQIFYALE